MAINYVAPQQFSTTDVVDVALTQLPDVPISLTTQNINYCAAQLGSARLLHATGAHRQNSQAPVTKPAHSQRSSWN